MKRQIKTAAIVLGFTLVLLGLCGCGKKEAEAVEESTEVNEPAEESAAAAEPEESAATDEAEDSTDVAEAEEGRGDLIPDDAAAEGSNDTYGSMYKDKINELQSEGLADQFVLTFIDEDESPELIASDSEGSFDHENAFIYTICNDEVVELAGVITGLDGGNLDYSEGSNLIHISGAAAGMRDVFYKISDGKLEEVFTAEATSMDEDAEYSINGSTVKENEYYEQINEFVSPYNPLTRIAYDGLYEVSYTLSDGMGYFENGSSSGYSTADEITG